MGAGHARRMYRHGHSPVHRMPPQCKLVAAFLFALVVAVTPRQAYGAFLGYAALIAGAVAVARVPWGHMARRMLIEVPFVLFAVLLPFVATGERIDVLGLSLSVSGLLGAWNVLAKGTLGVAVAVLLASTTELGELVLGLRRLRLPPPVVQIASFMIRYGDVIADELRRMRVARESRGFAARGVRSWGTLARSAGALFIRAYERGERVHLAMLSRGYRGVVPVIDETRATSGQWRAAVTLPVSAVVVCVVGWWTL